jgi:hypothetical protein
MRWARGQMNDDELDVEMLTGEKLPPKINLNS